MQIVKIKPILLLLFFIWSMFGLAQEKPIYILMDSKKNEMTVQTLNLENEVVAKHFFIGKKRTDDHETMYLSFDNKGNLQKSVLGSTKWNKNHLLDLNYKSDESSIERVLKINTPNSIDYDTFCNTKFSNVLDIIKEATSVYVIDLSESSESSNYYNAYKVKL